jgi:hypothetical protein
MRRRVEIADLADNMDTFRLKELWPKVLDRRAKYHRSSYRLSAENA